VRAFEVRLGWPSYARNFQVACTLAVYSSSSFTSSIVNRPFRSRVVLLSCSLSVAVDLLEPFLSGYVIARFLLDYTHKCV